MHLLRNAMDHGIESPEVRQAAGKPLTGTLSLNAYHDSGNIVIEVADDGAGLDRDKILARAIEDSHTQHDVTHRARVGTPRTGQTTGDNAAQRGPLAVMRWLKREHLSPRAHRTFDRRREVPARAVRTRSVG
jgi:hypothetical protein